MVPYPLCGLSRVLLIRLASSAPSPLGKAFEFLSSVLVSYIPNTPTNPNLKRCAYNLLFFTPVIFSAIPRRRQEG